MAKKKAGPPRPPRTLPPVFQWPATALDVNTRAPGWRDKWWPPGPIEVFTIVLAAFAGIQGWAFIQSERAAVTVTGISIDGGVQAQKPFVIRAFFHNVGKSTAYLLDVDINASSDPAALGKLLPPVGQAFAPVPAAGDVPFTFKATNSNGSPLTLAPESAAAIVAGTQPLYIFGYVFYTDGYWPLPIGRTDVCWLYDPERSNAETTALNACPVGMVH